MRIGAISSNNPPCVATIGFFDGVHRGHRFLIEQVREAAAVRGWESAVVTFRQHPRRVMRADFSPRLLTTCDEKLELLEATGLDRCLLPDFTPELSRLPARDFMSLLRTGYNVRALVIGYDHRFGHNRAEGFEDYVRHGQELGMEVLLARAYYINDKEEVSSSSIRRLLDAGDVGTAARLLGYRYFLQGTVTEGHHVGRTIGFPTANLHVNDPDKLVPADGVYAIRATADGTDYGGMLSIGLRPTLNNGTDRTIEAHLFGFRGDLYSRPLRLSFLSRIREERKFESVEALAGQLRKDEREAREAIERESHHPSGS